MLMIDSLYNYNGHISKKSIFIFIWQYMLNNNFVDKYTMIYNL